MSVKEGLTKFVKALQAYDDGYYKESFTQFISFADSAKLFFNCGMIAIKLEFYNDAVNYC
jgi:hypothetical protein